MKYYEARKYLFLIQYKKFVTLYRKYIKIVTNKCVIVE